MGRYSIKAILTIAVPLIAVVLLILYLSQCQSTKTAKKQNEVSSGAAGASIGAGAEAVNTIGNVAANGAATDAAVAQGQDEVRSAPEADKGTAAVNAACRFKANRDKPECKEPRP